MRTDTRTHSARYVWWASRSHAWSVYIKGKEEEKEKKKEKERNNDLFQNFCNGPQLRTCLTLWDRCPYPCANEPSARVCARFYIYTAATPEQGTTYATAMGEDWHWVFARPASRPPNPISVRCESRACGNKQFVTWRVEARRHTLSHVVSIFFWRTHGVAPHNVDVTINSNASRFPQYLRSRRSLTSRLSLRWARQSTTIQPIANVVHYLCALFHR